MSNPRYKPFKPPRPADQGSSTDHKSQNTGARATSKKTAAIEIASSESDAFDSIGTSPEKLDSDADLDIVLKDAPATRKEAVEPAIPPQLLSRLVHEHFVHDDTKITKEAMSVLDKYIEVFAMEALGRANQEREQVVAKAAQSGTHDGDLSFLEVEDLEKLSPQLLLDI